MLLSAEELEGVLEQGLPPVYHDPSFHDTKRYLIFIVELYECGVVRFSDYVRVSLGTFFVKKKNGKIRLIMDCRATNRLFAVPPSVEIGTGSEWSALHLSLIHI